MRKLFLTCTLLVGGGLATALVAPEVRPVPQTETAGPVLKLLRAGRAAREARGRRGLLPRPLARLRGNAC